MNRNLAILVLLLAVGLGVTSFFWNAAWLELGEKKLELAQQRADTTRLKADLKARDEEIEKLKSQAANDATRIQDLSHQAQAQSKDLQALDAELAAQRARVEEKRKQYAAVTANTGADAIAAAKLKALGDELQILQNQKRSVDQDVSNTDYDASTARLNRKRDSQMAISQANAQVRAVQDEIRALQAQRAAIPHGRGTDSPAQTQDINAKLADAQAQLNALKLSDSQLQSDQKNQTQLLEGQIKKSLQDLRHEQGDLQGKIDAKKAEIYKLQQHGIAANSFQKERSELVAKLTNELKEEVDKLKTLESRVQAQKAKADAATSASAQKR